VGRGYLGVGGVLEAVVDEGVVVEEDERVGGLVELGLVEAVVDLEVGEDRVGHARLAVGVRRGGCGHRCSCAFTREVSAIWS
jgi:hypothetical protein